MASRSALSELQVDAVLAALPQEPLRDQVLIVLGIRTGFRISELLSIRVGDVLKDGRVVAEVTIERRELKGGRNVRGKVRSRRVPLSACARELLARYVAERQQSGARSSEPLFLSRSRRGRLSRWQANRIVHRILERAGVPADQAIGTHSLRKTFARRVYQLSGHDINLTRHILGHRHIETTVRYLAVDDDAARAAILAVA